AIDKVGNSAAAVRKELGLLESSSMRTFPDVADRALAGVSDLQGIGGSSVWWRAEAVGVEAVRHSSNGGES
ncbi:MAG: hypothetical protein ACJ754_09365, partial [Pyrinomonadaceae bacterium]